MSQILVQESFLIGSMFVPNFMKIERGPDFFLLIWYGMTHILFDEGAQHSFISLAMANELQITPVSTTDVAVTSFSTTALTQQKLGTTMMEVETESGELIPLSVLIVPSISAPIQNSISTSVRCMPHLRGLKFSPTSDI